MAGAPIIIAGGNGFSRETAADAAEVVAVEQIGLAILAERKHARLGSAYRRHIEQHRVGAAEIGIARIERMPISGRKVIACIIGMMQIGRQTDDRLAVREARRPEAVPGRDKQGVAIRARTRRGPDPGTAGAGRPVRTLFGSVSEMLSMVPR